MPDDLVLDYLKAIRRDISGLATKEDLAAATTPLSTKAELADLRGELEDLRGELVRHFVEVETRITTEVHELIGLLRDLVASRDRLAARVSQLERDMADLKRHTG